MLILLIIILIILFVVYVALQGKSRTKHVINTDESLVNSGYGPESNAMTVKSNSVKPAGEFADISNRVDSNA